MSEETFDPFAPQEGGAKTKFGKLKLFASPVTLESGASYQIKSIHDRDGNVRDWKGKRIDKSSKRYHIVMHVRADDKDGNEYEMTRDFLNSDKAYTKIAHPAMIKVFGDSAKFPAKDYAFVKFEEALTGETYTATQGDKAGSVVEKSTWKVVEKFVNETAMKAAEKEFFSRFTQSNGHVETASDGPTFSQDMIVVFKKNTKKGVEYIVENLVDDEVIEKYGKEVVTTAIAELIA
jgi:hypothetical protein